MKIAEMRALAQPGVMPNRPLDEELDMFGVTHQGRVRPDNQDHFLMCTVHPQVVIHGASLPNVSALPMRGTRLATLLVVADGVGGAASGSDAARLATESVMSYVATTLRCYHSAGARSDAEFLGALREAAAQAHESVLAEAASRPEQKRMATTLTVSITVWPWMYFVQVGDSRGYIHQGGKLRQVTRDQTLGQQLVDQGAMAVEQLRRSPLKNVLASAIGSDEAVPEVTRVDISDRNSIVLLCSDGLTKHVGDEEIADRLGKMRSSEQVGRELLDLALARGGSDNVTLVVVRAPVKPRGSP
jgi:serine/threonine protein phosphatase PrpC